MSDTNVGSTRSVEAAIDTKEAAIPAVLNQNGITLLFFSLFLFWSFILLKLGHTTLKHKVLISLNYIILAYFCST